MSRRSWAQDGGLTIGAATEPLSSNLHRIKASYTPRHVNHNRHDTSSSRDKAAVGAALELNVRKTHQGGVSKPPRRRGRSELHGPCCHCLATGELQLPQACKWQACLVYLELQTKYRICKGLLFAITVSPTSYLRKALRSLGSTEPSATSPAAGTLDGTYLMLENFWVVQIALSGGRVPSASPSCAMPAARAFCVPAPWANPQYAQSSV